MGAYASQVGITIRIQRLSGQWSRAGERPRDAGRNTMGLRGRERKGVYLGGSERRGDRKGNSGRYPEGARYPRRKPGGGGGFQGLLGRRILKSRTSGKGWHAGGCTGCNGMVGLSAGRKGCWGGLLLVGSAACGRTPTPPGRCGRRPPHRDLEGILCAPGTSGAQGGQDAPGRRLIFWLMDSD